MYHSEESAKVAGLESHRSVLWVALLDARGDIGRQGRAVAGQAQGLHEDRLHIAAAASRQRNPLRRAVCGAVPIASQQRPHPGRRLVRRVPQPIARASGPHTALRQRARNLGRPHATGRDRLGGPLREPGLQGLRELALERREHRGPALVRARLVGSRDRSVDHRPQHGQDDRHPYDPQHAPDSTAAHVFCRRMPAVARRRAPKREPRGRARLAPQERHLQPARGSRPRSRPRGANRARGRGLERADARRGLVPRLDLLRHEASRR